MDRKTIEWSAIADPTSWEPDGKELTPEEAIPVLLKEIKRLQEEVKRYKPVLLDIVHQYPEGGDKEDYWAWRSREALQMKEGE